MRTKEYILDLTDTALHSVQADQLEVGIYNHEMGVTRFANSIIHQNIVKEGDDFWARVIIGKKIGGTSIGSLSKDRVIAGMRSAAELAKYQKEDMNFQSLPKAKPIEQTEEIFPIEPAERASCVEKMVKCANKYNLTAAGAIYTTHTLLGIANSLGIRSIGRGEMSRAEITVMSDDSSGLAHQTAKHFRDIDPELLAETACEKALMSKKPIEIEPGKYTVLLEPRAVAEFIAFLSYIGFGARSYLEGTSFMAGKIGKKITGDNITIVDDAYHPNTTGFRFDYEGMPTEKVMLIEQGIAKNVCYDSYYANKEGKKSTGHAMPQPNSYGPYPRNIILMPGNNTKEEMLSAISDGILVTRFWYTRLVDPDKTLITGMTRDGTFRVKDGKIAAGIKNMRYTANILETLGNVIMGEKELKLIGNTLVPALLIKDFNFSGKTGY
ncbi:MAG: TldD/PmbA family protein [Candidatus Stahlbacteria bacterium]|nr:TldD/PmbA family protein [Candidatus Stahlbacteria bacterium]